MTEPKKKPILMLRSKMREGPVVKTADLKPDVELQAHQKRVVKKLKTAPSLLLYHPTGSGKTLSSIAATEGDSADVIVPAALRENYKKELGRYSTTPKKRRIMSYEAASKGLTPKNKDSALIIDEAQRLGTSSSLRTQAILKAAPKYKKRILLSGTPIKNNPSELGPLAHILDPESSLPLDPTSFKKHFIAEETVDPGFINRYFRGMRPGIREKAKNLDEIRQAFRGKVDYVAPGVENYPEKSEQTVKVPMSTEQENVYNTILEKANPVLAAKIRSNFPLSRRESSDLNAFLTGPRLASNAPELFGAKNPSPKFLRALKDFKDASAANPDHKALTYSAFLGAGVDPYAKLLEKERIPYGTFTGAMTDAERRKVVEDYNEGRIKNLLVSGAASEGIDLRGTRDVAILDPFWHNARLQQVAGRGIRYGSHADLPEDQRNVRVMNYHSVLPKNWWQKFRDSPADTSVDEYLANMSRKKDQLNGQFLDVLRDEGSSPAP